MTVGFLWLSGYRYPILFSLLRGAKVNRLFALKAAWALGCYVVFDTVFAGMGMGVPIFCILFGFPVGWFIVRNINVGTKRMPEVIRKSLLYAVVTSAYTFIMMAVIWGRCIPLLFDPGVDYVNFGIPMILYDPKLSFIGWLVLMIFITPFLQLLATVFSVYLTLLVRSPNIEI